MQKTKQQKTMKNHVLFFAFFQSAVREANSQQRSRRKALVSSCLRGQSFRLSSAALWPPCLRGISFHFSVVHPRITSAYGALTATRIAVWKPQRLRGLFQYVSVFVNR